jgi:hypothetical protein
MPVLRLPLIASASWCLFLPNEPSPQLIKLVSDLYPDSIHVRDVALHAADDQVVWD